MYYLASTFFPAKETYLESAILADDVLGRSGTTTPNDIEQVSYDDSTSEKAGMEKGAVETEVRSVH